MGKRLIWMGAILLSAMSFLFENNAGTATVLVCVVVIPLLGLLPLACKAVQLEASVCAAREKGAQAEAVLTVTNPGMLPLPRLYLTVRCKNIRTGETAERRLEWSLLPKQRRQVTLTMDCPHCGRVEFSVAQVRSCDLFGLFQRPLTAKADCAFTVLPVLFEPSVLLEQSGMAAPDSDAYCAGKPGSDPGEIFGIREYVPADPIRSIHWKLAEKTDRTMVREFGLPVVHDVALLLENAGDASPDETDAVTEVFASLSAALANQNIRHHIYWWDAGIGELRQLSVAEPEEAGQVLEQLLELPPGDAAASVALRFTERFPHCPYAHVVLVGARIPAGVRALYNGNRVSLLIPRREGIAEGLQGDGTHVLTFDADRCTADLCRLEV